MNEAAPVAEPAPSDPAGPTPPHPPLRRSRRHKVIAGVCGGLGRQWDLDPVIFRIVLAVLSVGGVGLILYGFAWLAIPLDGEEQNEGRRLLSGRVEGSALTALLFALVGCGLFLTTLAKGSMMSFAIMLLLAVGGSAYWSQRRRQAEAQGPDSMDAATAQAVADAPPETKAPPVPASPSWWRDPRSRDAAAGGYLWGPETTPLPLDITYRFAHGADAATAPGQDAWAGAARPPGAPVPAGGAHPAHSPRRNRRPGRPIGGLTFLLALFGGAGTALAVARHATFVPSVQAGLAAALVVFGLGLVLSAWFGRTGGGTVFLMVLTAMMLAGVTVLPRTFTADWQNRSWAPTTVAAVRPHYALGSGSGELDLGGLSLKGGRTVHTSADVGAGRLQVTLPPGVTTHLHISVGLGDIRLPGEASEHLELLAGGQDKTITLPADGLKKGEKPHGVLDLDLSVGAGQVDIQRATPPLTPPPPAAPAPVPTATTPPSATAAPPVPATPRPATAPTVPTRQGALQ
ncbi:PspC domain-containing protein [Streptomyces sp. NPDC059649]|uniref:PspC domain-containing protein n=1 Tax=Streptomyces sp. NPDC059649 TaxID=3346895 RepID=UPI0036B4E148